MFNFCFFSNFAHWLSVMTFFCQFWKMPASDDSRTIWLLREKTSESQRFLHNGMKLILSQIRLRRVIIHVTHVGGCSTSNFNVSVLAYVAMVKRCRTSVSMCCLGWSVSVCAVCWQVKCWFLRCQISWHTYVKIWSLERT